MISIFNDNKMTSIKDVAKMICKIHEEATGEHKEVVGGTQSAFTHNIYDYLPCNDCLLDSSLWSAEIILNDGLKKIYTATTNEKKKSQ